MKKLILLPLFCITLFSFTQKTYSQSFWENVKLNVGATLGDYSFKSETQDEEIEYSYGLGFKIGLDYELQSTEKLKFETGISLTNHNSSIDQPELNLKVDYSNYWLGTFAMANYEILPNQLSAGLGVFADYGISATQQFDGGDKVNVFESQNGNDDAPMKRLNYGIASRISYKMSWTNFADDIYVSYRLGLADLEGADGETQTFKTGMITIGVRAYLDELF